MSLPTSLDAYADCVEVWNRAEESDFGVRVKLQDRTKAIYFRMRMHQARVYHRREAQRVFPVDDPRWGKSAWDPFQVKLAEAEGGVYVSVERILKSALEIEEIPGDGVLIEHEPQRALAPPREALPMDGDDLPEAVDEGEDAPYLPHTGRRF